MFRNPIYRRESYVVIGQWLVLKMSNLLTSGVRLDWRVVELYEENIVFYNPGDINYRNREVSGIQRTK